MLAKLSEAGLECGLAVTTADLSWRPDVLANVPTEGQRSPSGLELAGLGVSLALAVLIPIGVGLIVDGLAHSSPLGALLGTAVGIVAAALGLRAAVRRYL